MKIELSVDEFLFEFTSEQHWVNNARSWFLGAGVTGNRAIAVDKKGRVCLIGKHFMQAEREIAYPIKVYRVRPESES